MIAASSLSDAIQNVTNRLNVPLILGGFCWPIVWRRQGNAPAEALAAQRLVNIAPEVFDVFNAGG
jgi:hypothetical protein